MRRAILTIVLGIVAAATAFGQARSCCGPPSATEAFANLGAQESFRVSHVEPLPFVHTSEQGTWVTFKTPDGSEGRAYQVAGKKGSQKVVFLIHEWWGLNDYIRREAEKLQAKLDGATVLALDLYDKRIATTRDDAARYMGEVKEERAKAVINGALGYVGPKAHVGTIGWCFGGGWSLQASLLAGSQARACVMYYGMPEKEAGRLKDLRAPVLGIFASQDGWITRRVVEEFEESMKKAKKSLTVRWYDAGHAFANPSNPQYDRKAAEDAWEHAVKFLKTHLR